MKDATGELSMTAVAVVAIAAIGVVFSTLIWPQIRTNIMRSTYCANAFDCTDSGNGMQLCHYCADTDDSTVSCNDYREIQCSRNRNDA